jgi:heptosyltransferase I
MKVLIIKTSSMGDIIHTLPALSDAGTALEDIQFDWVVEKNFAQIVPWHPLVNKVIECELRRWRKAPWRCLKQWRAFKTNLLATQYDLVIDAQGLLKSAFITRLLASPKAGFSFKSCTESLASLAYDRKYFVPHGLHAIDKIRSLFALALDYKLDKRELDYGLAHTPCNTKAQPYIVFAHTTTWSSKRWPLEYWQQLVTLVTQAGWQVKLPWGNTQEKNLAQAIAANNSKVQVLDKTSLIQIKDILSQASAIVGVDTGLTHLAAALSIPTISLYGSTDPNIVGSRGSNQTLLNEHPQFSCAPCMKRKCFHKDKTMYASCLNALQPQEV